ncbi:hypothetical protein AJ85_10640 [Alkalihalobacillus alcalophilus ATCC 27647 = CGMCC 1.3604]|uniref:Uncharacterized protein n=1 Tax=Alkalihalobacillus alcalophilus ATCC 27647 = CGMCC 1.3604 TaxID=1218173 RepID=A0A4S4K014_ALKAL|nr:hypothetical protein AJ85_10640 [Alkalihalobacillus alcalophilus ATCC 27647 = CGMCC 1.3604]
MSNKKIIAYSYILKKLGLLSQSEVENLNDLYKSKPSKRK